MIKCHYLVSIICLNERLNMVFIMSKKINVNHMNIEALSNYNVASLEIIRLTEEKANVLKPLREKKAQILAERTKALAVEGAVLDDVLRQYSTDKVDAEISAVNFQYAEPLREATKSQNKVLKLVNANIFYAYAICMDSMDSMFKVTGEFTYEKKNGEHESVKIGTKDTFYNCIKSLYEDLGAYGTEDEKSMAKVINFHAKRVGGLKFDRKTQDNVLKKKAEITNGVVRDVIKYLESRGTIIIAEDGSIKKVEK